MKYSVHTFRTAGLEAKWSRNRAGAPIIVARDPRAKTSHQRDRWWTVGDRMWDDMIEHGIREAFTQHTLLGDIFSI